MAMSPISRMLTSCACKLRIVTGLRRVLEEPLAIDQRAVGHRAEKSSARISLKRLTSMLHRRDVVVVELGQYFEIAARLHRPPWWLLPPFCSP